MMPDTKGGAKQSTRRKNVSGRRKHRFKGHKNGSNQHQKQEQLHGKASKFDNQNTVTKPAAASSASTCSNKVHEQSSLSETASNNQNNSSTSIDRTEIEKTRVKSASEKKLSAVAKTILNNSQSLSDFDDESGLSMGSGYDHSGGEIPSSVDSQDELDTEYAPIGSGYRIIWTDSLIDLVNKVHRCKNATLKLLEHSRLGLHSVLSFKCSRCGRCSDMPTSCPNSKSKHRHHQGVDINRRAVFASLETGLGRESLATICELLELPTPVLPSSYVNHEETILDAQLEIVEQYLKEARDEARRVSLTNAGLDPNDSSLTADLAVSFDGTWSKRGYTANNGIGFVISADTGKVLDFSVLSKYCHQCKINDAKLSNAEFEAWRTNHKCDQNHDGSSSSMEVAAAIDIWERSKSYSGIRYRYMISDGDSKAYTSVRGTYGLCATCEKYGDMQKTSKEYKSWTASAAYQKYVDEHEEETAQCLCVYKMDCIGHVQKRLGKHLRTLHKAGGKLSDGKSVKGSSGRLTEGVIDRLQKYYGNAIRKNVDPEAKTTAEIDAAVKKMRDGINAVLHHSVATPNAVERHKFCPNGDDSWCKFKRTGEDESEKHHLDAPFLSFLQPTFDNLSTTNLLKRCLPGYTQNTNESLNGLVWVRAPKHKWYGTRRVKIAVTSAILRFNNGASVRREVMTRVNMFTGIANIAGSAKKDKARVKAAIKKSTDKEKKHRQKIREAKIREQEKQTRKEGQTYSSGTYDDDVMIAPRPKRQKKN